MTILKKGDKASSFQEQDQEAKATNLLDYKGERNYSFFLSKGK
jgi:hypothetical protein